MTDGKTLFENSNNISKAECSITHTKEVPNSSCNISPPSNYKFIEKMIDTNKNNKDIDDFYDFPDDKSLFVSLDDIEPTIPLMEIPIELLELEGISPNNVLFPVKGKPSIFSTYAVKPSLFAIQDAKRKRIKELSKPKRSQKK